MKTMILSMARSSWFIRCASVISLMCVHTSCSLGLTSDSPPDPTRLEAVIEVSANINPDTQNRPSPLVVRVYELASASGFNNADFFDLYDEAATVQTNILGRDEFTVMSLDKLSVERKLHPSTRFIGVIAAYREIDETAWRAVRPIAVTQTNRFTIRLEQTGIFIEPTDKTATAVKEATVLNPTLNAPRPAGSLHSPSTYSKYGGPDVLE